MCGGEVRSLCQRGCIERKRKRGEEACVCAQAGGREKAERRSVLGGVADSWHRMVAGGWTQPLRRYLVDPASSDMLVSKIKPCMCKYKQYTVKLRKAQ